MNMEYYTYGYEPSYSPINISNVIEDIGCHSQYDISITNPNTEGFISIRENGNIEAFANSMVGLRINKDESSVNLYGDKINIIGQLKAFINRTGGKIELIESGNESFLSQKAHYIGINSDREINIGSKTKETDSSVSISADVINIDANKILINGKEFNNK